MLIRGLIFEGEKVIMASMENERVKIRAKSRLTANFVAQVNEQETQNRTESELAKSRLTAPAAKVTASENGGEQKRRLIVQIVCFGAAIILLVVLFLTVAFPLMVHYTGVENSKKYVPVDNQLKPQTPILNAPTANTSEDKIQINGFAPAGDKVQFIIDGEEDENNLVTASVDGTITFEWRLTEGENTLAAYTIADDGLESDTTKEYRVNFDKTAPTLEITQPESQESELVGKDKQTLTITGVTEAQATVVINTQRTTADGEGNFSLNYLLQNGDNDLKIVATDKAENQTEVEFKVKFTP